MTWPADAQLGLLLLVLARVSGVFAVAPLVSTPMVPTPVRAGLAFLVALGTLAGVAAPPGGVPQDVLAYLSLAVHEVLIGLVIGFLARVVYLAGELAGSLCDVQLGLTMASVVDPVYGEPIAVMGNWFNTVATLAYIAAGGVEVVVMALAQSYRHLPVGAAVVVSGGAQAVWSALGAVFTTALALAAPVLGVGFLLNVLLGVASRAMPQLNALQSVLPAQVLGGLLVLLLATTLMVAGFTDLVPQTVSWIGRLWS